jgi:hypothetical protein
MAVNQKIDRVIEQINDLKNELSHRMTAIESELSHRLIAVETKLDIGSERRNRYKDFAYQMALIVSGGFLTFGLTHLH